MRQSKWISFHFHSIPHVFWPGKTTEVTFSIKEAIWSPSGTDYLLNHNKTHSIFFRKGMERFSFHFTHSLLYKRRRRRRSWWKSQSQLKAMLLSYIRALHTARLLHSGRQISKKNTPTCCENEFIHLVIKYSTDPWLVPCIDYCLSFQPNVICSNKTARRHVDACEAGKARRSQVSRLCWLAELQQMCFNIAIK